MPEFDKIIEVISLAEQTAIALNAAATATTKAAEASQQVVDNAQVIADTEAAADLITNPTTGAKKLADDATTNANNAAQLVLDNFAGFIENDVDPTESTKAVSGNAVGKYAKEIRDFLATNLFDINNVVNNVLVVGGAGQGNLEPLAGYSYIAIPATRDLPVTISNLKIGNFAVAGYTEDVSTKTEFLGDFNGANLPITFIPTNINTEVILIRVKNVDNVLADYEDTIIQYGTEIRLQLSKYLESDVNTLSKSWIDDNASSLILVDNTVINSSLGLQTLSGWKVYKFNAEPNTSYTFDNLIFGDIRIAFTTGANAMLSFHGDFTVDDLPLTVNSPADATTVFGYIQVASAATIDPSYYTNIKFGDNLKVTAPEIGGKEPNPFDQNLNKSDNADFNSVKGKLITVVSDPLNEPSDIIDGQFISSVGVITTSANWKMIKLPVIGGTKYLVGGFSIENIGYYAFYDDLELLLSNGSYRDSNLPLKLTAPETAEFLYVNIKRPNNVSANFSNAYIKKYLDINSEFTGGTTYDQSLNVGDNVQFGQVQATSVEVSGVMPTGTLASPPSGLEIGDYWKDTTDSADHPIIRQSEVAT
jgi:hypothetical protein